MKIRSIILINGNEILNKCFFQTTKIKLEYGIDNNPDLKKIFKHKFLTSILEIYKSRKNGFIVFYFDVKTKSDDFCFVDKTFFNMIKKIKIPTFYSEMDYDIVCKMLMEDCPEYDEIVSSWLSAAEIYQKIVNTTKKFRFKNLNDDLKRDLKLAMNIVS